MAEVDGRRNPGEENLDWEENGQKKMGILLELFDNKFLFYILYIKSKIKLNLKKTQTNKKKGFKRIFINPGGF